jgi:hypothetical protein
LFTKSLLVESLGPEDEGKRLLHNVGYHVGLLANTVSYTRGLDSSSMPLLKPQVKVKVSPSLAIEGTQRK